MPAVLAAAMLFYVFRCKLDTVVDQKLRAILPFGTYSVEIVHDKNEPKAGKEPDVELALEALLGIQELFL